MTKKEKANIVIERLKQIYPQAICSLNYNKDKPYELLMAVRLSAQCTDARVNVVTKPMFEKYRTLESIASADISDIESCIKSCGFFRVKAKDLVLMAQSLINNYNSKIPDSIEELTKLPGVGRKTANLIMGDIYKKPAVVTDTHCIRISARLGLTSGTENPPKCEDELRKVLPPQESSDYCHRIVMFGRDTCTARNPKCESCKLNDICKYAFAPDKWKKK